MTMVLILALGLEGEAFAEGSSGSLPGERVTFDDGRSLVVRSIEREGDFFHLELVDGGRIGVLRSSVVRVERVHLQTTLEREEAASVMAGWRSAAGEFADLIGAAAAEHDLDPRLLTAVASVESAFDPFAVSAKGACGLLQLIPETAERFGVDDVFDAAQNVTGGARYLRWLLDRFDGRTELALAGYNAGEGAVDRYGGVPPYRETRDYVRKVTERWRRLGAGGRPGDLARIAD